MNKEELKAEIQQRRDELLKLTRELRQLEHDELPDVPIGSYWRSRTRDSVIHVTDVRNGVVVCNLLHVTSMPDKGRRSGGVTLGHELNQHEIDVTHERITEHDFVSLYAEIVMLLKVSVPERWRQL